LVKPGPFGVSLGHEYIQDIPTSSEIHFHAGSAPMTQIDRSPWRVKAEHPFQLKNLATLPAASEASKEAENDAWPALFQKAADKLEKLQSMLHAEKSKGLLLVLQGMDTAGKDGCIWSVFSHVSPFGVRAKAFGVPSEEEQRDDFLWRIH
jgi:polyphosphate kinase 2 (PPK2 family)